MRQVFAFVIFFVFPAVGFSSDYVFTILPGTYTVLSNIIPLSINNKGDVVGDYFNEGDGEQHGFLVHDGKFSNIDYPGASTVTATGINDDGDIVGVYGSPSLGVGFGSFLYHAGAFTVISIPGVMPQNIEVMGINNSGDIAGTGQAYGGYSACFVYNYKTNVTTFLSRPPNFYQIYWQRVMGVSNDGKIVGYIEYTSGDTVGFIYQGGGYTFYKVPNSRYTWFSGINKSGEVVGNYSDMSFNQYAFLYKGGGITPFSGPGGSVVDLTGINDSGMVIGNYEISSPPYQYAYLALHGSLVKALGYQCSEMRGDPIHIGTGNKYQEDVDVAVEPVFVRSYNSASADGDGVLGQHWQSPYQAHVVFSTGSNSAQIYRPDGRIYTFSLNGGIWTTDADVNDNLVELADGSGNLAGWRYTDIIAGTVETYDVSGNLQTITDRMGRIQTLAYDSKGLLNSVTDPRGRTLSFGYDGNGHLATLTDPAGGVYHYGYDSHANLMSVTYPDGTSRQYLYENSTYPHALTGIIDENGIRYSTTQYDSQGRAILTEEGPDMATSAGKYSLSFSSDGSNTVVTDPLGTARTYGLTTILGVVKGTGISQPGGAGCGAASSKVSYDANGNALSRADFNGTQTCYAYDSRNLETTRVEGIAAGSSCPSDLATYTPSGSQRKITTAWHPDWRQPVEEATPLKQTIWVYNGQADPSNGNAVLTCDPTNTQVAGKPLALLCKKIEQATSDATGGQGLAASPSGPARIWSYSYAGPGQGLPGQLVSIDGPRTDVADVTRYAYYTDGTASHRPGDLKSVTNALGQETTFDAYDAAGRPTQVTDPNGQVTRLSYDVRGRLSQRQVGTETTAYQYDAVGELTQIRRADGSTLNYRYDAAHRLTDIVDGVGDTVHYTLDAMGNRIKEEVKDPTGSLTKSLSREYDALNRVKTLTGLELQ